MTLFHIFLYFLVSFGVPVLGANAAETRLWAGLEEGLYPVGFRLEIHVDNGEVFDKYVKEEMNRGRATRVQIAVWYPAREASGKALQYGDYFDLRTLERYPHDASETAQENARETFIEERTKGGAEAGDLSQLMETQTAAGWNALAAGGAFPLIVLAQGSGAPVDNLFILAEYLASHGFVVISMPHTGFIHNDLSTTIMPQIDLINVLIERGSALPGVDQNRVGLVAHSQCGACIILHQDKFAAAQALLVLDGWDGWDSGVQFLRANLTKSAADIDVPYAYLASDPEIVKKYEESPTGWNHEIVREFSSLEGGFLLYFNNLRHVDFSSDGLLEFTVPNMTADNWQEGIRTDKPEMLIQVYRYALWFLEAQLKESEAAVETLCRPLEENGFATDQAEFGPSGLCGITD